MAEVITRKEPNEAFRKWLDGIVVVEVEPGRPAWGSYPFPQDAEIIEKQYILCDDGMEVEVTGENQVWRWMKAEGDWGYPVWAYASEIAERIRKGENHHKWYSTHEACRAANEPKQRCAVPNDVSREEFDELRERVKELEEVQLRQSLNKLEGAVDGTPQ